MYPDTAVNVEVVFSDVAKLAFEPDAAPGEALMPAHFIRSAHFAMPGDLVQLPGAFGVFVVTHRVWRLKAGKTTLRLVLDVLVPNEP